MSLCRFRLKLQGQAWFESRTRAIDGRYSSNVATWLREAHRPYVCLTPGRKKKIVCEEFQRLDDEAGRSGFSTRFIKRVL
jgi:hypothetical protein